jgi:hypothetical protein
MDHGISELAALDSSKKAESAKRGKGICNWAKGEVSISLYIPETAGLLSSVVLGNEKDVTDGAQCCCCCCCDWVVEIPGMKISVDVELRFIGALLALE